jgi:hypothetical protein
MAKKAAGEATTAWIRYSQAKALASEYLGDSKFVERELQRGLAAGEIPWRCVRFEAPEQYSGPGCGDPEFWKLGAVRSGRLILNMRGIRTEGDSATRIDGAAAYGIDLDRSALVRLKLLPPDDVDGDDTLAKVWAPRVARDLKRAGKLDQVTKKTELANLIVAAGVAAGRDKVGTDYIRDNLEGWDSWPISKIKI